MAGPMKWGGLLDALVGEWDKTKQPLKERATMLPLGQYEDGSVGLAWPGLLADPVERSYQAANTPIPAINDDQAWADKSAAMFDMTSLAPLGGVLGAVDNAVGSAGGKLMKGAADLPMDQASRMARAKEMGFDTERTLLHGTRSEFDEFAPSKTGSLGPGVYLTNDPIYARGFAEGEMGRVLPVMTRGDLMPYHEWRKAMTPESGETVGQTMERARRLAEESGYTGVQYGDNSQVAIFDPRNIRSVNAAFDPAKADSANLLAANAKEGALPGLLANALDQPQGIRAYHGSPHDFDRFDISKIGTGEGAQAYGHGLYFADSEGVARSYRDALAKEFVKADGERIPHDAPNADIAYRLANHMHQMGKSADELISDAVARAKELEPDLNSPDHYKRMAAENAKRHAEEFAQFAGRSLEWEKDPGRMYEVNIKANPEDFLDWDKPLSQQSEVVRKAIEPLYPRTLEPVNKMLQANGRPPLEPDFSDAASAFYGNLDRALGGISRGEVSANAATQALREAGIPGIKYLDGMSRNQGEGSSNYVVFDDALIEILRKYANPVTGAIPGLAAQTQDGTDPQTITTANILRFLRGQ